MPTSRGWGGHDDYRTAKQRHPHPVAQKPKNAWGLHDVHGNVWEWCAEAYDGNAYAARADGLTVDPRRLTFAVGKGLPMSAESADRGAPRVCAAAPGSRQARVRALRGPAQELALVH
jgi:formylglycine-generating enzyme required for sulfatase activity